MILCKRCGKPENELHHKIPRCIGGTDLDGRVYLCKKCHDIWHNMLPKYIFKYVPDEKKKECQQFVKRMCDWWVNK